MNSFKKFVIFSGVVTLIVLDLLILLIRKDFNSETFWVAFSFINFSFIAYIIGNIIVGPKTGVRGIQPITTFLAIYCMVTTIVGVFMMFISKLVDKAVVWAYIPFIFISGIAIILIALASLNGPIIRKQSKPKPMMFSSDDVPAILSDVLEKVKDSALKTQIRELLMVAKEITPSQDPELVAIDQRIFEYTQFLYKNVTNNEMDNVYNNIKKLKSLYNQRNHSEVK